MTRHEPFDVDVDVDRQIRHRLARRGLGGLWWLALLLIPLLLAALMGWVRGEAIEKDLTTRAVAALRAEGIKGVTVDFDGRDGTLTLPAGVDADKAQAAVEAVDGVRVVTTEGPKVAAPKPTATTPSAQPTKAAACDTLTADLDALLKAHKIQFAENSATISAGSRGTITQVANLLKACDSAHVVVGGHTDNQGSTATSGPLSQRRADAVKAALVDLGIAADRITAKGFGESQPIASNSTAAGRAENRRISIQVQ